MAIDEHHRYDQDGLFTVHNHEFMNDFDFRRSYARGVKAAGTDYNWHWRVHVGLWAAQSAEKLDGDFVECGVNRGFMSSAIMELLRWDDLGRTFYLLDTFSGIDQRYTTDFERADGIMEKNRESIERGFYVTAPKEVIENFAQWRNQKIIVGPVSETLSQIDTEGIALLLLDMNCAPPEIAAVTELWDKLVEGAVVLFDDYAYHGYRPQKLAIDEFASSKGLGVLSLPTGQGLLIKPVSNRTQSLQSEISDLRNSTSRKILAPLRALTMMFGRA